MNVRIVAVGFSLLLVGVYTPSVATPNAMSLPSPTMSMAFAERFGVRDASGGDFDGDGIPDDVDVDDDNDGIEDSIEGLGDNDADGVVNCLDLDSDNDGITDLTEAVSDRSLLLQLDANNDGFLDNDVFLGANGLADLLESAPDSGQSMVGVGDDDGDGVVDQYDLDSDNDGLPDLIELGRTDSDRDARIDFFRDVNGDGLNDTLIQFPIETRDTDADGQFDFRDIDSDNDGLSDRLESSFEDVDNDGRIDVFVDNNGDGLFDSYASDFSQADSDGDGLPNHIDLDSDGDGVPDSEEGFVPGTGSGDGTSDAGDGGANEGSGQNGSQDGAENAGSGESPIEVGREGSVFGCSAFVNTADSSRDFSFVFLLVAGFLVLLRRTRTTRKLVLGAGLLLTLSGCATQAGPGNLVAPTVHFGAGLGVGLFDVEPSNQGQSVSSSQGSAGQLTLGLGLHPNLSMEGRIADLGVVTFNDSRELGYQLADLSGVYQLKHHRLTGFGRMGVGALFNSGDLAVVRDNDYHFVVGVGVDYALNSRWGLRAEWSGHDVDVSHAEFSVLYRLGQRRVSAPIAKVGIESSTESEPLETAAVESSLDAEPRVTGSAEQTQDSVPLASKSVELAADSETLATEGGELVDIETAGGTATDQTTEAVTSPTQSKEPIVIEDTDAIAEPLVIQSVEDVPDTLIVPREETQARPAAEESTPVDQSVDSDADGFPDVDDQCQQSPPAVIVDITGCTLIGGVVRSIAFVENSAEIIESADSTLSQVVQILSDNPDMRLVVTSHTRLEGDPRQNLLLSRKRTLAVVRALLQKGIDSTRLLAQAYGDTQPLENANSDMDHERVELLLQ
ncbi:MAG: OmpA family protein [Gammaproteobacteria bacterium]|nr:OmpA family protein [Gammaproteobacteria bacterium]